MSVKRGKAKVVKKSVTKAENEYNKIRTALHKHFQQRPDEYLVWKNGDGYDFCVLRRLIKNVKTTFDKNIFMIVEKCEEEAFVVPLFISILKDKKKNVENTTLNNFGCKFITINAVSDIEWKLEENR